MKKINNFFLIGFAGILIISALLLIITNSGNIYIFKNITSLYGISKIIFLSFIIFFLIGYILFKKEYKNYIFQVGAPTILAPIIFISLSYIIDLLLGGNLFINHIFTYLFVTMMCLYISYIFLTSKITFKLASSFTVISIIFLVLSYMVLPTNLNNHIFLSLNSLSYILN